ncbi:MAG: hypothetical protein K1060chlam4_00411 [Candidatus Anoxychlamydiales bacterium]|nr:hypothetical protein [Candidatus Anoxychlamydiales bacterium]
MKILVPASGEDITKKIDEHFSKAKYFIFMDVEKDVWEVLENEYLRDKHPGDKIAAKAIDLKVQAMIVTNIGPHAFDILSKADIKVFFFEKGSIKEAIDKFKRGVLAQMFKANKKHGKLFKED